MIGHFITHMHTHVCVHTKIVRFNLWWQMKIYRTTVAKQKLHIYTYVCTKVCNFFHLNPIRSALTSDKPKHWQTWKSFVVTLVLCFPLSPFGCDVERLLWITQLWHVYRYCDSECAVNWTHSSTFLFVLRLPVEWPVGKFIGARIEWIFLKFISFKVKHKLITRVCSYWILL